MSITYKEYREEVQRLAEDAIEEASEYEQDVYDVVHDVGAEQCVGRQRERLRPPAGAGRDHGGAQAPGKSADQDRTGRFRRGYLTGHLTHHFFARFFGR